MNTFVRKLNPEDECPIDNYIYLLVEPLVDLFCLLKFTPNMITSLSAFFGILSIYFLSCKQVFYFSISFLVFYILDCCDGFYARKFNMCTPFGDYYDHLKDLVIIGLILSITIKRLYRQRNYQIIYLTVFMGFMLMIHFSCQETNPNIHLLPELCQMALPEFNKNLCVFDRKIVKYFGCGTFISYLISINYIYP